MTNVKQTIRIETMPNRKIVYQVNNYLHIDFKRKFHSLHANESIFVSPICIEYHQIVMVIFTLSGQRGLLCLASIEQSIINIYYGFYV